jgi:hypothetical protein
MPKSLYVFSCWLLVLILAHPAAAQWIFFPLGQPAAQQEVPQRKRGQETPPVLSLPFFEDFSGQEGRPDPDKWVITDSSVWVNNTFGVNAPSSGVATFDGSDALGRPYDFVNIFRADTADRLESHAINLNGVRASDSVYFTFFWQAEGLGEKPSPDDSLKLEFLNRDGEWERVWAVGGFEEGGIQPFRFVRIVLTSNRFFHNQFKFRFFSIGRLAGGFDTWNLDYLFFYRKADLGSQSFIDLAISKKPESLLKRYYHMPLAQFKANPVLETRDTIYSTLNNLSDTFNLFSPRMQIRNAQTGQVLQNLVTGALGTNSGFSGTNLILERETMRLAALNNLSFLNNVTDSITLDYTFLFDTLSAERFTPTRTNDTLSNKTILKDFYAYDDGTAEFAVGMFQRFSRLAYRFELNEPAFITDVDLYVPRVGINVDRLTFNLFVWTRIDTLDQRNDQIVFRQNVPIVYPDAMNEFRRIPLPEPLLLNGTIYVGYEQLSDDPLTIGYDRNTLSGRQVFFNLGSQWQRNSNFEGSLMIRPVFRAVIPTATPGFPAEEAAVLCYPNPADQVIYLHPTVEAVTVFDLNGRQIYQKDLGRMAEAHPLDTSQWKTGLYLLRLSTRQGSFTRKIQIQH